MKKLTVLTLLASASLAGCIVVTDREDIDDWESARSNSWEREQEQNRTAIADLRLGTGIDEIRSRLGDPEYSEGYRADDHDYIILRYRTQHRHSDGDTTFDETTPLLFEDGVLVGWGESVISRIAPGRG